MKYILTSIFLWLALLLPATANAHDFEVDGIYYNIKDTSVIVTYKGADPWNVHSYSGNVIIPETVNYNDVTYRVTAIGVDSFYDCDGLTSVTIPNTVISIGARAFRDCSGLSGISIPCSVTAIGSDAFTDCSGLKSVTVANENKTYDSRDDCNAIIKTATNTLIAGFKITTIPYSVMTIGDGAFVGCTGLTSVTIPNSVINIGDLAFAGCVGLNSVTIPKSVINIGDMAFESCSGLTSLTIPNSVTYIGSYAFNDCSGLTWISIPNSITSLGNGAFEGCSSLTDVYSFISDLSKVEIGTSIFYMYPDDNDYGDCDYDYSDRTLHVFLGSTDTYQTDDNWSTYFGQIMDDIMTSDVDSNGTISINDVVVLIDYLLNENSLSINFGNANVDGDGSISIADVTALIDLLLQN